jgi:endonuclease-3
MPPKGRAKKATQAEPSKELRERSREICRRLVREYPEAKCRLAFMTPYELLVATILAAQCTDDMVNKVTPVLFGKARTPAAMAALRRDEIEAIIRPTGFYHNKAKSVHEMSRVLAEQYGGEVPRELQEMVNLPGVARKTANVVRAAAFGLPAIITDTHFIRLSQRLGLTANTRPDKIEFDLAALLPEDQWSPFSHAMLFHGRAVCTAKKPACDRCVVSNLCPSAFQFPHFEKK